MSTTVPTHECNITYTTLTKYEHRELEICCKGKSVKIEIIFLNYKSLDLY